MNEWIVLFRIGRFDDWGRIDCKRFDTFRYIRTSVTTCTLTESLNPLLLEIGGRSRSYSATFILQM
jgi:hypothetical protein